MDVLIFFIAVPVVGAVICTPIYLAVEALFLFAINTLKNKAPK